MLGLDRQGKVTVFNKTAEEITGYSRAEIMGHSWERVVPRDRYGYAWKNWSVSQRVVCQSISRTPS